MSSTARETILSALAAHDRYDAQANTDAVLDGLRAGGFVVLPVADVRWMVGAVRAHDITSSPGAIERVAHIEEAIRGS